MSFKNAEIRGMLQEQKCGKRICQLLLSLLRWMPRMEVQAFTYSEMSLKPASNQTITLLWMDIYILLFYYVLSFIHIQLNLPQYYGTYGIFLWDGLVWLDQDCLSIDFFVEFQFCLVDWQVIIKFVVDFLKPPLNTISIPSIFPYFHSTKIINITPKIKLQFPKNRKNIKTTQNHTKMSLLSKTQYTKISNNLQQIQYQLTEQSNNICNKIQLTLCKIDCIKEVIQQENESNLHEGADKLIQVRERVGVVKDYVCGVQENFQSMNAKSVFQELTKQLNQIQSTSTLNRNERTKQQTALQYKLDEQLSTILEQATQQHNQQLAKIKQLEKQLFSELRECEQDILNSRKQMQSEQEVLLGKVEQIGKDLHSKVKMLREVRKNKKNNFLDLLQNVINKVQDMHVVKI